MRILIDELADRTENRTLSFKSNGNRTNELMNGYHYGYAVQSTLAAAPVVDPYATALLNQGPAQPEKKHAIYVKQPVRLLWDDDMERALKVPTFAFLCNLVGLRVFFKVEAKYGSSDGKIQAFWLCRIL
jgi:hypothetical protein